MSEYGLADRLVLVLDPREVLLTLACYAGQLGSCSPLRIWEFLENVNARGISGMSPTESAISYREHAAKCVSIAKGPLSASERLVLTDRPRRRDQTTPSPAEPPSAAPSKGGVHEK